ncbi:MAG: DUF4956 domain-containing protein [Clostridia bacterium]|nr:DUF4956 domain-containing protein [Clostridia bacterium]
MDLFKSIAETELTLKTYLLCALFALISGAIVAFAATFRTRSSKSLIISLVLLPVIVQTVIIMVNGNIGTGIAVAGAFSLVRFRSVPGKAREIAAIFLAMTSGLACAAGYVGIALIFTVAASLIMLLLTLIPMSSDKELELKITVPEQLNYRGVFDDIFKENTKRFRLTRVKTTNMGSLFKLEYRIEMKKDADIKKMIDLLRERNGNLEIAVSMAGERNEEL